MVDLLATYTAAVITRRESGFFVAKVARDSTVQVTHFERSRLRVMAGVRGSLRSKFGQLRY